MYIFSWLIVVGTLLAVGDICYINNAYTTLFKNQMILYQGTSLLC